MTHNINNRLNSEIILYCIKYKNIPIYIGSTIDLEHREKSHNKQLINSIKDNYHFHYLYDFLKDKLINNENGKIGEIKLVEVKKIYNDIVIISDNTFECRRNIEEEKLIRHCLNKGVALLNMKYPCKFWIDDDNKIIERNSIERNININEYKITSNKYIIDFINTKSIKELFLNKNNQNVDDILFN